MKGEGESSTIVAMERGYLAKYKKNICMTAKIDEKLFLGASSTLCYMLTNILAL